MAETLDVGDTNLALAAENLVAKIANEDIPGTFVQCDTPEQADTFQLKVVEQLRRNPNNLVVDFSSTRLKQIVEDEEKYGLIMQLGFTHTYTAFLAGFVIDNANLFEIEAEDFLRKIVKDQPPNNYGRMNDEMLGLIKEKRGDRNVYAVSGSFVNAMKTADGIKLGKRPGLRDNFENFYYPRFVARLFQDEGVGRVIVANEPLNTLRGYASEHTISDTGNGVSGDIHVLQLTNLRSLVQ